MLHKTIYEAPECEPIVMNLETRILDSTTDSKAKAEDATAVDGEWD